MYHLYHIILYLLYYNSLNDVKRAEKKHKECYKARREHLGDDHDDTLASMVNLAKHYKDRGYWSEAERYLRSVIELNTHKYGNDHEETLTAIMNSVLYYMDRELLGESEKYLLSVIELKTHKYGLTHTSTLASRRCLARLFELQKNYEYAEKLCKRALVDCLRDRENTKLIDTIRTSTSINNYYCYL